MELLDRRVLGAIEFVDAVTAARVRDPLRVTPSDTGLAIAPNRSALYVIRGAPGLAHHLGEFERMPAAPPAGSIGFDLAIADPGNRYLARSMRIALPRKDAAASDPESVLNPIVVPLYPAAAAPVAPSWAVLRVRVQTDDGTRRGLANALVVVSPQLAGSAPVTAMTDERGEALAAVAGVAYVLPAAGGAVLTRDVSCDVETVVDRRVVRIEGADAAGVPALVNPESIAADRAAANPEIEVHAHPAVALSAGKSVRLTLEITWP